MFNSTEFLDTTREIYPVIYENDMTENYRFIVASIWLLLVFTGLFGNSNLIK